MLVFRVENQVSAYWGVPLADPPMVMRMDLEDEYAEPWDAWLDRFSLACVEMVLSESLFGDDELGGHRALTERDVALLEQRYTRLPMPEYPVSQTVPGIRRFADPDGVLREDSRQLLWVRGRTHRIGRAGPAVLISWPADSCFQARLRLGLIVLFEHSSNCDRSSCCRLSQTDELGDNCADQSAGGCGEPSRHPERPLQSADPGLVISILDQRLVDLDLDPSDAFPHLGWGRSRHHISGR